MSGGRSTWQWVQLVLGTALGVGLMAWFLGSLEWRALGRVLWEVELHWVGLAVVAILSHYGFHAWRWGLLLKHLDDGIPLRLLWSSTTILWGFNTVMPLRAGNVLRPMVISRHRHLSFTSVLFATAAEYICDAFGILVMLGALLWVAPTGAEGPVADAMWMGQWIGLGALLGFTGVLMLTTERARVWVERITEPIGAPRLRSWLRNTFEHLAAGVVSIRHPMRFGGALASTLGVWGSWLGAIVSTLWAFGLDLPLEAAIFLEAALSLAMMVPQAPGFLGMFQVVTEQSLGLWHAPAAQAQAVALVFWSVCFVPVTVLGLLDGARLGLNHPDDPAPDGPV